MRRSTVVTLTLLAGTGLGVAYCASGASDGDAEGVLESQAACVNRLGADAATECTDVFEAARAEHEATAPRFDTAEACRVATGADCVSLRGEASAAAPVFIPVMAGVMIGQALFDGARGAIPVYAGMPPSPCPPPYPPGVPAVPGCVAPSSGSGSGSGSTGSSRRFWYSGTSYAGSSDGEGRGGFRRASVSGTGGGMLSRGAGSAGSSRSGLSASRAGGLGFSAAAHGGGRGS